MKPWFKDNLYVWTKKTNQIIGFFANLQYGLCPGHPSKEKYMEKPLQSV